MYRYIDRAKLPPPHPTSSGINRADQHQNENPFPERDRTSVQPRESAETRGLQQNQPLIPSLVAFVTPIAAGEQTQWQRQSQGIGEARYVRHQGCMLNSRLLDCSLHSVLGLSKEQPHGIEGPCGGCATHIAAGLIS